jgi:hypothetical protein
VIVFGKRLCRAAGFALALALAAVCLGSLCSTGAMARDLEVPTFLAPGVNPDQSPSTVPGGRPFELVTTFAVNRTPTLEAVPGPAANIRNLSFELPAGVVANAATFPRCTQEAFNSGACSTAAQVGVADVGFSAGQESGTTPIFNMVPPPGMPAQFAFRALLSGVHIDFRLRNGSDYGATAHVTGLSEAAGLLTSSVTIWGVPGDPGHDALRYTGNGVPAAGPYPEPAPFRPLLSNPTSCNGPLITTMEATTWQHPNQATSAAAFEAPAMSDCNQLDFNPTVEVKPTTSLADSPSGLDLHLNIPQNQDPAGGASAHLRSARIVLPAGFGINPSAANGLGTCSPEQIGWVGSSNERQLLRYDLPPTNLSGSFVVTLGGKSTPPILATATRAQVTAAIETLPGLAGNISLSGAQGGWIVSFVGALAGTDVAAMTGTVADPPSQIVAVTGESGSFTLHFGDESTPAFPFNASPEEVQEALRALPAFGLGNLFPGNVFVVPAGSQEITRSYQVFFVGDLAGKTEPVLTATSTLTGLEAGVVITPQPPGPPRSLSTATFGGIAPGTPQFTDTPVACPDAAKIGTVRIDAPAVVGHPLEGNIYLASQGRNPFGSLLAIYITADDPAMGLVLKLPGKIESDPRTGQLSATVSEAPQLPFEDLQLEFFKGTAAPLRTAIGCGDFVVDTDMTPWGAPEGAVRHPKDTFRIDKGAAAGACVKDEASAPATPSFEAGTIDPTAGLYSPFALKLSRADGTQQLTGIDATLPKGLLAKLTGLHPCPDAALAAAAQAPGKQEQMSSSCPAASRVGTVNVRAGAGPTPFYAGGSAYLAGPYKGAPLSLAMVTPAVAGPFDLGTVVLRSALFVDPQSTQVHVVSDPFPSLLGGIPLDLRSVALNLDAAQFTKNPTSCNALAIGGSAALLSGQSAPVSSRFQVGDCSKLAFKPKLALALKGGTKRAAHPALKATLSYPSQGNYANIAAASFSLPKSVRIDKTRIKPVCTQAQFAAHACPPATVYGSAQVSTPLLDNPLKGPVYLRSGAGKLPPELVVDLKGAVDVVLSGRLQTTKGGAVLASFENVPDVPISKFSLELQGTKKGLLENAANLCARPNRATALIDGQNAASIEQSAVLANGCKKKKAGKGGKGKKRAGRKAAR